MKFDWMGFFTILVAFGTAIVNFFTTKQVKAVAANLASSESKKGDV
nr:MAG: hypothetical protein [Microviridae sp.]